MDKEEMKKSMEEHKRKYIRGQILFFDDILNEALEQYGMAGYNRTVDVSKVIYQGYLLPDLTNQIQELDETLQKIGKVKK